MLMSIKVIWFAAVFALLLTAAPTVAQNSPASGTLTGTYVLDARPTQLVYLSLTQSASMVSGYAVIVEPNTEPQSASLLTSRTFNIEGTASGPSVTLVLGNWVSGQITMTGTKHGDDLVLTYPNASGEISTVVLHSSSQYSFNQVVTEWRADIASENLPNPNEELIAEQMEVVEGNPEDIDAILLLANILGNSGRLDEAIPYYEQAVDLAPDDPSVRLDFARSLADGDLQQDAELQFQRALELEPESQEAMYYLAELYFAWSPPRTEEAMSLLEKVIALNPDSFIAEQAQRRLDSISATPISGGTPAIPAGDGTGG